MKVVILSLILIVIACKTQNAGVKSIEIIEYDYFFNSEKNDWDLRPLTYYLVKSDGEAIGYTNQIMALEDNSFSAFKVDQKLIEDFMLLADTADLRNRPISSQFSTKSTAQRVTINYKNDNYKTFFLPKSYGDNELVRRIELHKRNHQFVDSIPFTKEKSISKVDTIAMRKRIENLAQFAKSQDKFDDRLMPPPPAREDQIQFIKREE